MSSSSSSKRTKTEVAKAKRYSLTPTFAPGDFLVSGGGDGTNLVVKEFVKRWDDRRLALVDAPEEIGKALIDVVEFFQTMIHNVSFAGMYVRLIDDPTNIVDVITDVEAFVRSNLMDLGYQDHHDDAIAQYEDDGDENNFFDLDEEARDDVVDKYIHKMVGEVRASIRDGTFDRPPREFDENHPDYKAFEIGFDVAGAVSRVRRAIEGAVVLGGAGCFDDQPWWVPAKPRLQESVRRQRVKALEKKIMEADETRAKMEREIEEAKIKIEETKKKIDGVGEQIGKMEGELVVVYQFTL